MSSVRTISVALNRPLDGPLTYELPGELADAVEVGALVEVPLSSQKEIGAVVTVDPAGQEQPTSRFRIRPVARRVSPDYVIPNEIMNLARWMAEYYFCSLGEALAAVSMVGFGDVHLREQTVYRVARNAPQKLTARQQQALDTLASAGVTTATTMTELAQLAGASAAIVKKLVDLGAVTQERETLIPPPALPPPDSPPVLHREQAAAIEAIEAVRNRGDFGVFLLHGVTGSGKTEVYLRLIERVLAEGKSALCLVPEISLTPQTVDRFARRFQQEIGVFHSQLSRQEKLALHEKILRGQIRLVIGARSATFAPLPNLGIIIIDEEHESSYKQSETPRYHARDLAIIRASRLGVPVVLGSATPSLESFENAQRGKYELLRLTERPAGLLMPEVRIVPMGVAAVRDPGALTMLSPELENAIRLRLARGEQTILFLNRRGFSNFLMCPYCHWVARCEEDDIVLTIHRKSARGLRAGEEPELELELFPRPLPAEEAFLKCHFCGKASGYPTGCPKCGEEMVAVGTGTQRIEEALRRVFPDVSILRLDQDSVGGRRAFLKAWQEMVNGQAQIILGTQMIAKGLHLERVTLVGVILADVGLFVPDFRAEERTFSLLMQVAGRAGRANMGEVLLQTYMPHHSAIQLAAKHDYVTFFDVEMVRRRKMRFPPAERLIALTLSDEDLARAQGAARLLAGILRRVTHRHGRQTSVLGPQAAPIARLAGRHRQRLLIRGAHYKINAAVLHEALRDQEWRPPASVRVAIDVDPQDLL